MITRSDAILVALIYEAGLNRNGGIDYGGLNFWIDRVEDGLGFEPLAQRFLDSPEFTNAFGDVDFLSNRELVEQLYRNVLDREGEQSGIQFWLGRLQDPSFSRADLLVRFADSPENANGSQFIFNGLTEVTPGRWEFRGELDDIPASTFTNVALSERDQYFSLVRPVSEISQTGDSDWFALDLFQDFRDGLGYQGVVVSVQGESTGAGTLVDPTLTLRDGFGDQIRFDDDGGIGFDAQIDLSFFPDTTYYAEVESFTEASVGTYQVNTAAYEGTRNPGFVDFNPLFEIDFAGDRDWFKTEFRAGETYEILLEGFNVPGGLTGRALNDPIVRVLDVYGNQLASNDDGGPGFDSRLLFTAPEDGLYFVEAGEFGDDATGGYALDVLFA